MIAKPLGAGKGGRGDSLWQTICIGMIVRGKWRAVTDLTSLDEALLILSSPCMCRAHGGIVMRVSAGHVLNSHIVPALTGAVLMFGNAAFLQSMTAGYSAT